MKHFILNCIVLSYGVLGFAQIPTRPNIVFIRTDDQTYAETFVLKPNGQPVMPNVQALARAGTSFTNNFVSIALCTPARASFLTGQYAHHNHVFSNSPPDGGVEAFDDTNTLATWLKAANYTTCHIGKYLNGYGGGGNDLAFSNPPGWDDWYTTSTSFYFNYSIVENGVLVNYGDDPSDYNTDVLTDKAVTFIHQHAADRNPFFICLDYQAPHKEALHLPGVTPAPVPAPRHVGVMDAYIPPQGPAFNEADVSDKPTNIQNLALLNQLAIDKLNTQIKLRLETLLAVDEGIGRIVQTLADLCLLDNTVIIFTSDNGFQQGEHRLQGKAQPYEESIRMPCIWYVPGLPGGQIVQEPTCHTDFAPTIVALARTTAGLPSDGISLLPLLANPAMMLNRTILLESANHKFIGVRTKRYIYVEYDYDFDGVNDDLELYVLANDPFQLVSQHNNPAYQTIIANLHNTLVTLAND